jgi:hypothetical protein
MKSQNSDMILYGDRTSRAGSPFEIGPRMLADDHRDRRRMQQRKVVMQWMRRMVAIPLPEVS